jgi:NAD(P)-dependent dehydrogenase (short-subunit alcohol dehydrogenase family)
MMNQKSQNPLSRRNVVLGGAAAVTGVAASQIAGSATVLTQSKNTEAVEPNTIAQNSSESRMLEGKVAFVTGAARGIGRAIAISLAQAGNVIIITSTFGRQGNDTNPAYVTSKWGLVGLTKAAAIELGEFGITVNAIAPTAVRTGLGGPQTEQQRAESNEFLEANYHTLPVGLLEPADIGGTAVFLASPAAKYISGAVIDVAAGANARYTA